MLLTRNLELRDKKIIQELWNHSNPIPDLFNPLYVSKKVVLNGETPIAIAAIKLILETTMFMGEDVSRKHKVLALNEMINQLKSEMQRLGINQAVSFTDIGLPLMQHFGFSEIESPTKVNLFL